MMKTVFTRLTTVGGWILGTSLVLWAATSVTAQPPQQYTAWGLVQELEAGWVEDTLTVRHAGPMVNPAGCSVTNAGYATNPADAGHDLFHTLVLSAFLNRKEVSLLIGGCVYNKPRIIAVKVH